MIKQDYLKSIENAGFTQIEVLDERKFSLDLVENDETLLELKDKLSSEHPEIVKAASSVVSMKVRAYKPE